MGYITSIKTAIITFPFIAMFFTIPFILRQYHKYGAVNKLRTLIVYSFILYLLSMYFLIILPLPSFEAVRKMTGPMYNLVPFAFVRDFIADTTLKISDPGTYLGAIKESCFFVVIFNIIMTMPFAMYLRYYFKCSFKKTVFCTFLLSLFFELTQLSGLYFIYPRPYRLCDIDDLIQNTMGGVLGYLVMGLLDSYLPSRDKIDMDSIEVGKNVSGLRRITLFCLDCFIFTNLSGICSMIINSILAAPLVFILYYAVLPRLCKGYTLGGKFLNVRLEYPAHSFIRLLLTAVINYLYYFVMPVALIILAMILHEVYTPEATVSVGVLLGLMVFYFLFYLINFLVVLTRRKNFYDRITKVTFCSTIDDRINKRANKKRKQKDEQTNDI